MSFVGDVHDAIRREMRGNPLPSKIGVVQAIDATGARKRFRVGSGTSDSRWMIGPEYATALAVGDEVVYVDQDDPLILFRIAT